MAEEPALSKDTKVTLGAVLLVGVVVVGFLIADVRWKTNIERDISDIRGEMIATNEWIDGRGPGGWSRSQMEALWEQLERELERHIEDVSLGKIPPFVQERSRRSSFRARTEDRRKE